jgi:hypothetical protein
MRRFLRFLALALGLFLAFLVAVFVYGVSRDAPAPFDTALAAGVRLGEPVPLVPGPGLPADLHLAGANNNLDVVRFGDRVFLAVRNAKFHFASDDARLLVLSSPDRRTWTLETTFDLDRRDLREPRFLVLGGRLLFYFFEAADAATGFAPIAMRMAERRADGTWSESRPIFEPGHVPWRAKVFGGRAYLSTYDGRGLYDRLGRAGGVRLLVSDDGEHWTSLSGAKSPIDDPGASECDYEIDEAGNLVALARVEARGALVCTAPAGRLEHWDCTPTSYRHDSPLLFRDGGALWAIARRSLGGPLDTGVRLPESIRTWWLELRYWTTRKRTTLYRVLPDERRTVPVLDLPSRGDTAFAGRIAEPDGSSWIVNYTSPLDGPDWPWVGGQLTGTVIYGVSLRLPPAP